MRTHQEITTLPSGAFSVRLVQDHVVTEHEWTVDVAFLQRLGLSDADGLAAVRAVSDILVEHEALAALPRQATLEQLVVHYPYLVEDLQQRLRPGATGLPVVESVQVIPVPIDDHPTHT